MLRSISQKHEFALILVVAVALNYVWELAQAPLYSGMRLWADRWWHCFIASLADGLLVALIAVIGWVVLRSPTWYRRPGIYGYLLMAVSGLAIAVIIERLALANNRWSYTDDMPILPIVSVGILPVLQMIVLPPAVFAAVSWMAHKIF
jgi:hypothetical protein